jgi:hypothetical protein
MEWEEYEFTIPEWAVTALEYGDFSGLTDDEEEDLENFTDQELIPLGAGHWEWGDESYFARENDVRLQAGNVVDAVYHVRVQ